MDRAFINIIYTVVAIFAIVLFKNLEGNVPFFERVGAYWDEFKEQKDATASPEEIRAARYDGPYQVAMIVKKYMDINKVKDPVILLEPNDYLKEKQKLPFSLAEPIVFYNFTGIKAVWMNSKNVAEATHILYVEGGNVKIAPITSKAELQQILDKYKAYTPAL